MLVPSKFARLVAQWRVGHTADQQRQRVCVGGEYTGTAQPFATSRAVKYSAAATALPIGSRPVTDPDASVTASRSLPPWTSLIRSNPSCAF